MKDFYINKNIVRYKKKNITKQKYLPIFKYIIKSTACLMLDCIILIIDYIYSVTLNHNVFGSRNYNNNMHPSSSVGFIVTNYGV